MACRIALLRVLTGMAIITTLLGAVAAPASARRLPPDLLDLPAVALFPADLAAEGEDEFGLGYSTLLLPGEMTAKISGTVNEDSEDFAELVVDTGVRREYELDLTSLVDGEEPAVSSTFTVTSYIYELEDEAGATDLFTALEVTGEDPDDDLPLTEEIGDAADLSTFPGEVEDGNGGTIDIQVVDLTFRLGRLYLGLQLLDLDFEAVDGKELETPSVDLAIALAQRMEAKARLLLDGETPGLSLKALHLDGSGMHGIGERYDAFEGVVASEPGQDADTLAERQQLIDDFGIIARYTLHQSTASEQADQSGEPYFVNRVYTFESRRDARAFIMDGLERSRINGGFDEIEEFEPPSDLGDTATGATYAYELPNGQTVSGVVLFVQIGSQGFVMQFDAEDGVSVERLIEIAYEQAACFTDDRCIAPVATVDL